MYAIFLLEFLILFIGKKINLTQAIERNKNKKNVIKIK